MINDCRGIPKDVTERDICESDLKNTINGHIKKNYEVLWFPFFIIQTQIHKLLLTILRVK